MIEAGSLIGAAIGAAVKWGVPAALTALAGVVALKRRRIRDWRRKRTASRMAHEAMVESWPSAMGQIALAVAQAGRITEQFTALNQRLDKQDGDLSDLLAMSMGQFELNPQPTFVCDNRGCNTLVNTAYARMLHAGRDDLMGFGYRRFIPAAELVAYVPKFVAAAEDHREFESDLRMVCADGEELRVRVRMVPHPRHKGPATHWVGTITLLEGHC